MGNRKKQKIKNFCDNKCSTGEHALNGDGRKGGWYYVDAKGDGHYTRGKKPSRALYKAFTALKSKLIQIIQNRLKGL